MGNEKDYLELIDGEKKFRHIGTRPIRPDGVDKVTGRANFGADFTTVSNTHLTLPTILLE